MGKVDPTFGLKNKKGKKNREFVRNTKNNMNADQIAADKRRREKKAQKEMIARMKREEAALFATVDELPQFKDKKKKQQEQQEEEEKVVLNDEELLDQCAPDELDELI